MLGVLSGSQVLSYPIVSKINPPHLESTSLAKVTHGLSSLVCYHAFYIKARAIPQSMQITLTDSDYT